MLLTGRTGMICLLAGMLLFGKDMVYQTVQEETVTEQTEGEVSLAEEEAVSENNRSGRMEEQYQRLKEEEIAAAAALQEKEETLSEDDESEQAEAEELRSTLHNIRLQEKVLRARMEETGKKVEENPPEDFDK